MVFRWGHTALVFNKKMWVLGGYGAEEMNDVWCSSDGLHWTSVTIHPQWPTRYLHSSVVHDGKMWVLGGIHQSLGPRNDVWYSTNGTTWTCATARTPFVMADWCDAVAHAGKIWVLGSIGVWSSTNGTSWTLVSAHPPWLDPLWRFSPKAIVCDGRIWVIGGKDYFTMGQQSVWSSADGVDWQMATRYAYCTGRVGHALAVFNGKLWLLGGFDAGWKGQDPTLFNDVWYSAILMRPTSATTWTRYP